MKEKTHKARTTKFKSACITFIVAAVVSGSSICEAGLKIFYIRHAQGGHNVTKEWEAKKIPKTEWPSYVGNPNMFTPKGKKELLGTAPKLGRYQFDFIACSPIWRARNTIIPYMKEYNQTGEIWPELREGPGMKNILSPEITDVTKEILNQGGPIVLPEEEQAYFTVRSDAKNNYSRYPKGCEYNTKVSYTKHVTRHVIDLIEKRFGGTDKSILIAGHNSSGFSLLMMLLNERPKVRDGLNNTGIWMVEQQDDRSYKLMMYNDEPILEK